jgi:hypothetical protein
VRDGQPRVVLTIRLPDGVVTADLAAKSLRRAIAMVREHGAEGVTAIVRPAGGQTDHRGGAGGAAEGGEASTGEGRGGGVSAPSPRRG